jgi:hypothetical protein
MSCCARPSLTSGKIDRNCATPAELDPDAAGAAAPPLLLALLPPPLPVLDFALLAFALLAAVGFAFATGMAPASKAASEGRGLAAAG